MEATLPENLYPILPTMPQAPLNANSASTWAKKSSWIRKANSRSRGQGYTIHPMKKSLGGIYADKDRDVNGG